MTNLERCYRNDAEVGTPAYKLAECIVESAIRKAGGASLIGNEYLRVCANCPILQNNKWNDREYCSGARQRLPVLCKNEIERWLRE